VTALLVLADAGWCGGNELRRNVRILVRWREPIWEPPIGAIPRDAQRIRIDGVVLPGLVDHHVHAEHLDLAELFDGGLSSVRDLGSPTRTIFDVVRRSQHSADLPRVRAVGPILTAPYGYPSDRDWAQGGTYQLIRGPRDARTTIRELASLGADAIKIAMHTGVAANLTDELLDVMVVAAHAAGLSVVAHAEGAGEPERAQRAGVDELAHTPWTTRLDEQAIQACAATMTWTSTIDIHGWGTDTPERRTAMDNLRRFRQAGGQVQYGTDLSNGPLPLGVNDRELAALAEAGFSPAQILGAIATSPVGLVSVPSDPLANPGLLGNVRGEVRATPHTERNPTT
jgi:hypothetical protein